MRFQKKCEFRKLLVVSLCLVRCAAAQTVWLTGDEMREQLRVPLVITWSANPARSALAKLAADQRVAIWLDRRIDPGFQMELSVDDAPLLQLLRQAAKVLQADVGFVGPVVYLGPHSTATKLWTIAELRNQDAQKLPTEFRSRWMARRSMQWEELSTPRELLAVIALDAGCRITGLETISHDLWPAVSLPPLTVAERLSLILAGFDRTFELAADGRTIQLTPFPERALLERGYPLPREAARMGAEIAEKFPLAATKRTGTRLIVTGTAEDHDGIGWLLRGEKAPRSPAKSRLKSAKAPETRYSITVKNQPLGNVLRTLEAKSQLQLTVDAAAQEKLRELVSFELTEASLEQLLRTAMQGTGLAFQLRGKQLHVTATNP